MVTQTDDGAVYVGVPAESTVPQLETPAATPTPTPKPRQHSYNSVDVDGPYIAMTFDDGPHPVHTPKLLDMLKARGIRATFYVVGGAVEANPEIARRIVNEGHEIANHTWSHPYLTKLSSDGVRSQIEKTSAAIQKATGVLPTNMRPPYGATNSRLNKRMDEEFGLKVIMWSVDPMDWRYRNSARVANEILTKTQAGGIVLAHDIHATTVAAMPAALDGLRAKGFKFVTVSELLAMEKGRPTAPPSPRLASQNANEAARGVGAASTPFVVQRIDAENDPTESR